MNGPKNSTKKTVLVTGATGNLGQAVVQKFLSKNYNVVASSHSDKFEQGTGSLLYLKTDLNDETKAAEFVENAISSKGRIHAAVFTVGGFSMGDISETDEHALLNLYRLNFLSAWFCIRPLFQHMLETGEGRIVLIGSKPGQNPGLGKDMVAYTLSKSLLLSLADILNADRKNHGIITSVIVPGTIDTASNRKAMPDADFSKWVTPEVMAEKIYYVCTVNPDNLKQHVIEMY